MSYPTLQFATQSTASSPAGQAFGIDVIAGSTLFLVSESINVSEVITGIVDSDGNTWTNRAAVDGATARFEAWTAPSGTAGANTVTVTYSAHTIGKRFWIGEIKGLGTPTYDSNTLNAASTDPMACATLTISGEGVVVVFAFTSTVHTFAQWDGGYALDMGGGTTTRAAVYEVGLNQTAFAPFMNATTAEAGESMSFALYANPQPGVGGATGNQIIILRR